METSTALPRSLRVSSITKGLNPRVYFDPVEMTALEDSIRAQGVHTPVLVRPIGEGKYQLIAGERRVRAVMAVFGETGEIPVLVKDLTDAEANAAALTENIERAPMTPVEEAEAAAKVLADCQGNRVEAANRMGWKLPVLDRRLALMYATDKVRAALQERKIDLGHAELLAVCRKEAQDAALETLLTREKKMTVQELKAYIDNAALVLDAAIFDKDDCANCHHNSSNQAALFAEVISEGRCSNRACFDKKTDAKLEEKVKALGENYQQVRIVRPGDKFTVTVLRADGEKGVGAEQAQACRVCKSFGAVVSALPDKMGVEYKSICMDVACNVKMIAARVAAEKAASAPTAPSAPAGGAGGASSGSSSANAGKGKTVEKAVYPEPSNRVQEYREKIWRAVFKRIVAKLDPVHNRMVLLALCLKNPGHIDSHKLGEDLQAIDTGRSTNSLGGVVRILRDMQNGPLASALQQIAANVKSGPMGLDLKDVVSVLKEFEVQLADHWKVNQAFLDLLTKNEIDAVCHEIGVSKAMGDAYGKARGQSKSDFIKAVLAVENFDLKGRIPKLMAW